MVNGPAAGWRVAAFSTSWLAWAKEAPAMSIGDQENH